MIKRLASSFRDPDGFIYSKDGVIYRQVNKSYSSHFSKLNESGLYNLLVEKSLLISHEYVSDNFEKDGYITLKPENLSFISYPYEWSFEQLKDAALTTLKIQKIAVSKGMILKDASAYNIQFDQGQPVFIDTLSFEIYQEGLPWIAYRQFCQHFLAPLALMAKLDINLSQLLKTNIDGIPLSLTSQLLPKKTWLNFGILIHIHLHAKFQKKNSSKKIVSNKTTSISKTGMLALIDSLQSLISKLNWQNNNTEWHDYYSSHPFREKCRLWGSNHKSVRRLD